MKKIFSTKLTLMILSSSVVFTAVAADVATIKLRTNENGELIDLNTQMKSQVRAETESEVKMTSPTLLKLEGRVPVILIPVESGNTEVKISPPTFREAAADIGQKEISYMVSDIMVGIQHVQKEIQEKNYDQAMARLEDLQKRFPKVAFLDFIRGSILLLKGRKSEARKAVIRALVTHPDFEEGKSFLKTLGGTPTDGGKSE